MIKNLYFKIICLFVVLFLVCYVAEKVVNKYSYTKGKPINKVKIPDIIQENTPVVKNLDVVKSKYKLDV